MGSSKEIPRKRKRGQDDKQEGSDQALDNARAQATALRVADSDWWHDLVHRLSLLSKDLGLLGDDSNKFKSFFRVSRKTFDYICSLVRQDLVSRPPSGLINIEGRLLSVEKQVAIALRRLASGDAQVSVGEQFGVGQSTVSQVTWRFVESMEERGRHHLKWPDAQEMVTIKANFEQCHGLPNCCGAMDMTHVIMTLPSVESSSDWYDAEHNYSMVLQAIVDAEMRFRDILTGWPGSMSDARLLRSSGFFRLSESGQRLNGSSRQLPQMGEVREYIVADMGYPLLSWLITPFQDNDLSDAQINYNNRHSATAEIAEKALARLKGTWRILHKVMWRPDKHKLPRIILVCCLLHNIIIDRGDELLHGVPLPEYHDEGYEQQICQFVDAKGKELRNILTEYLSEK
eukprot:c24393_g1_i1 orf=481-1683(+)